MRYERDGFSVEAARKKRRLLPDWYLDQPPPPRGMEFFYTAFRDLQTCRNADGPIPWTAARLYSQDHGLSRDVAAALWIIVHMMDNADRGWRFEQWQREREQHIGQ